MSRSMMFDVLVVVFFLLFFRTQFFLPRNMACVLINETKQRK